MRSADRLDPALRHLAEARTDLSADALPAFRESLNQRRARRSDARIDVTGVAIEETAQATFRCASIAAGHRLHPAVIYCHSGAFVLGNLDTDHRQCVELARRGHARSSPSTTGWRPSTPSRRARGRAAVLEWVAGSQDWDSTAIGWQSRATAPEARWPPGWPSARRPRRRRRSSACCCTSPCSTTGRRLEGGVRSHPGLRRCGRRTDVAALSGRSVAGVAAVPGPQPPNDRRRASAFITCSELDPLRDEAVDYARRLMRAGVRDRPAHLRRHLPRIRLAVPEWEVSKTLLTMQAQALRRFFSQS